ncbi:hypothetical protein QAD02_020063 [Eretmocerus hayati]|uniref:Uncharacterized protein n=1 Tax=Eretmocerus hayati TaxID=131215 RepID=A0ACC2PML1_9HYME|nr:hypothetical protein QAD02_020063 [Eretmocerus hayati]
MFLPALEPCMLMDAAKYVADPEAMVRLASSDKVSYTQTTKLADFIERHLAMAEGRATLEASSGWIRVTSILNGLSSQKPRASDDWRKSWEGYLRRAKKELADNKKEGKSVDPHSISSSFSKKVLQLVARWSKHQDGQPLGSNQLSNICTTANLTQSEDDRPKTAGFYNDLLGLPQVDVRN